VAEELLTALATGRLRDRLNPDGPPARLVVADGRLDWEDAS